MTKAFGYVRCALADASTMTASVAYQIEVVVRAAAVRGYQLGRVFIDIGWSTSRQTELRHLLERAALGGVSAIVVANMGRLSLSRIGLAGLQEKLDGFGVALISADEEDISDEAYAFAWTR